MRLLDRYLLREFLVPLGMCLGGLLVFWITLDFFSDLGRLQQLRLTDIAVYYFFKTPGILVFIAPIVLLLAVLYALTNHARHFEITAIRAAGISLWRMCLPYLLVGLAASLASFALNERWVSRCEESADRVVEKRNGTARDNRGKAVAPGVIYTNLTFVNAREGRKWRIGIYDSQAAFMTAPEIICPMTNGSHLLIEAATADREHGAWTFHNVSEFEEPAESDSLSLPLLRTNVLTFPEFTESPAEIKSEIRINELMGRARPGARADISVREIVDYLRLHPQPRGSTRAWLYTKLHERLAEPWTCLVVVLIAIPFGAPSGRRNVFIGVAGAIGIVFVYYVLQQLSVALGLHGSLPPWLAAWTPNLAFAAAGAWMTTRVR
jgi:lipopolysaccharide export system permease protein